MYPRLTTPYPTIALILGLVVFGFFLQVAQTTYITADEYLVYKFTRDDLSQTISYLANSDVHPPLWFTFFWGWRRVVGESDFAGRMQAILFSLMTLSVVFQLGKRWFGQPHFGIFAMVVLGVSGLFLRYSLEIRPYAFVIFLTSLSMFAFQQWISQQTRARAIVYAVSVAVLLYVHYFLLLFVLVQGIYFLLFVRPSRQLWYQAVGVIGLAFVLFLPWLPNFLTQLQHLRAVELASGYERGLAGSSATTQVTSLEEIFKLIQIATNGLAWLYAVLLVLGLFYWWRKSNYRLALMWAIGLPTVAFLLNLVVAVYTTRYIVNFVVGLALLIAVTIGQLPRRLRWFALFGFAGINLLVLPSVLPNDVIPFRALLKDLAVAYRPGDKIFIDPPTNRGVQFNWEYSHRFSQEMVESIVRSVDNALPNRRIWYLTGDWFNENIRATFSQIEKTHPRQSGFGQCDRQWCYLIQLMEAPPFITPQIFGDDMAFWGVDIDSVTQEVIQTRLWWRVKQALPVDYSISLQLRDKNDTLVAQADGPIHHYGVNIYNTSQLEPEKIYIDFRSLQLPPQLPAGEYTLSLIVYNWQTSERLLLRNGFDHLELKTIQIP